MKEILLLILSLTILESTNSFKNGNSRISGGNFATALDVPCFAQLEIRFANPDNRRRCGGCLIANNKVVTSANCVTNMEDGNATSITISLGIINIVSIGLGISRIAYPPTYDYTKRNSTNNIAVLTLNKTVTLSAFTKPSAPSQNSGVDAYVGQQLLSCGFGDTTNEGNRPGILRCTKLNVIPQSNCISASRSGKSAKISISNLVNQAIARIPTVTSTTPSPTTVAATSSITASQGTSTPASTVSSSTTTASSITSSPTSGSSTASSSIQASTTSGSTNPGSTVYSSITQGSSTVSSTTLISSTISGSTSSGSAVSSSITQGSSTAGSSTQASTVGSSTTTGSTISSSSTIGSSTAQASTAAGSTSVVSTLASSSTPIICTQNTNDDNVCRGDEGSPVFSLASGTPEFVGVVSYFVNLRSNAPCKDGHMTAITQVGNFHSFLTAN